MYWAVDVLRCYVLFELPDTFWKLCVYFIYLLFSIYLSWTKFTTRLDFNKQQDLSQIPDSVNNIAECSHYWHQTVESKSQFVVLIKVNPKQNRNALGNVRPTSKWQYIIKNWWRHKIIINVSAGYIVK